MKRLHGVQLTDRGWCLTSASHNSVDVGTAYATAINLDVNVVFAEDFCLELERLSAPGSSRSPVEAYGLLFEVCVLSDLTDHETLGLVWIRHVGFSCTGNLI